MAILQTRDGATLDTATLPDHDCPELWEAVAGVFPLLDPLDEDEATVDPSVFLGELTLYLREALGRGRKAPPLQLEFRTAGRIDEVSYWVFEFVPDRGAAPLFALVVHNPPAGEFACVDTQVRLGDRRLVTLTPEQAVVAEFAQSDRLSLREQYQRDGPRPGDDRED